MFLLPFLFWCLFLALALLRQLWLFVVQAAPSLAKSET